MLEGPCGRCPSVPACSVLPVAWTCVGFPVVLTLQQVLLLVPVRGSPPSTCGLLTPQQFPVWQSPPAVPCPVPWALLLWSKCWGSPAYSLPVCCGHTVSRSPESSLGEQAPVLGLPSVLSFHPRIFLTLLFSLLFFLSS